jgi:hypothetical protein
MLYAAQHEHDLPEQPSAKKMSSTVSVSSSLVSCSPQSSVALVA